MLLAIGVGISTRLLLAGEVEAAVGSEVVDDKEQQLEALPSVASNWSGAAFGAARLLLASSRWI